MPVAYPGGFENVPLQSSGALITSAFVNSQSTAINNTQAGVGLNPARTYFGARLTLNTGVPITTSDVTGASTVYLTPYGGGVLGLFDGTSSWNPVVLTGDISLALGTLTSGTNYDVFVYNNAGAAALELGPAWTDNTTRATALVLQDGVFVKSGATTRRYAGTLRTTSTTTTEDSAANRFLWNMYNRVPRPLGIVDSTATWTYNTTSWRQARASAANQVSVVVGLLGPMVSLSADAVRSNTSAATGATGIGADSTTAVAAGCVTVASSNAAGSNAAQSARLAAYPGLGYHYYAWLEYGTGVGADTWYGTSGQILSGLTGFIL